MSEYSIRFAGIDDIPYIMQFIDAEWKKNHILSVDRGLFEWQYVQNDKVNMVIGIGADYSVQGILGYIPYDNSEEKDICLALWKAKDGTAFLGVKLLDFLLKRETYRKVFCNGINMLTTARIYKRFGFEVGKLNQWYRLRHVDEYRLAKVVKKEIPHFATSKELSLVKVEQLSDLKEITSGKIFIKHGIPYKSENYILQRYYNHPVYEYEIYAVVDNMNNAAAAIVVRIQECNGAKALRVIDFLGEYSQIYHITGLLEQIADDIEAEYIDMYELGLSEGLLQNAGWMKVGQDENIIPNYFSPFTQCNVEINISTQDKDIILFKGDGDQDRPN